MEYRLFHRRTGNRGQTCLPVGLKVIDNLPLPARYQITLRFNGRIRGSRKPRPRLGASERKLAASWFYFSWKIEKEEKEKKENEDKKKDSQRNEKK